MEYEANKPMPQPRSARLGEVLLIALVFFVVAGDPAPHTNEPHYLCRLKHYWNPEWCDGDLFLESPEAHLTFVWALGWVTNSSGSGAIRGGRTPRGVSLMEAMPEAETISTVVSASAPIWVDAREASRDNVMRSRSRAISAQV